MKRIREIYSQYQDFVLLLILFIAFRVMALLFFRPGGYIADYSEFNTGYLAFARWSDKGLYPFIHYWLEWPPLFPWLVVGIYRLSLLVPSWVDPRLWYDTLLGLALLFFEIGNLVVIYLLALELYDKGKAFKCALIYTLLFAPLYFWLGWIDSMPLFFLLLGLYLLLRQRATSAGIALGLGFMTKITPAIMLAVGWKALRTMRRKVGLFLAFGVMVLAIAAPFLLARPHFFIASFRSMVARSSWETVWALLEGYYSYGVVAGDRFDPQPNVATRPSTLPWPLITLAFALLYLWLFTRSWGEEKSRIVAFAGLSINLFTLYNKGYSPQFLIQLIPFVVLLLPHLRGVIYILLLDTLNFLEATVYFIMLPDERWLLVGTVLWRTLIISILCAEYSTTFFSLTEEWGARLRRRAFAALVAASLLMGLLGGYRLMGAYYRARYAQEEYRPVVEFLRSTVEPGVAALILPDHALYQRLYPFLRKEMTLYVAEDRTLPHIIEGYSDIWLVSQEGEVETWLKSRMELVGAHDLAGMRLLHFKR